MGGWGSGPYGTCGLPRKKTVDETTHIYINKIKDCFDLNEGSSADYSWYGGKTAISILFFKDYIELVYKANGEKIHYPVNIDSTKVGFGERKWFVCPSCGESTARLYLRDKYFLCRDCQGLTYLSCQKSGDQLDYLALKISKLQTQLGMKKPEIYDLPYFKPKNMHHKTFMKLRNKLHWLQVKRDEEFIKYISKRGYGF